MEHHPIATSMNDEIVIEEVISAEELERRASWMKNREAFPGFTKRYDLLREQMRWEDAKALASENVIY